MISLCLTVAASSQRKIVQVSPESTLQELHKTACRELGFATCRLKLALPPFGELLDEPRRLTDTGVQHRDRIIVEEVDERKRAAVDTASDNDKKKPDVVSLLDMDSSDDESAAPAKKRSKHASAGQSSAVEAPIKILATVQDLERRKTHNKSDWSWTQTKTLREMILGDRHAPIQWIAMSNFAIDYQFLIQELLPEMLSVREAVIFSQMGDPSTFQHMPNIDLVVRNPSHQPKTSTNNLRYKFPYGTHHTKQFIVGFEESIRVVILTANLEAGMVARSEAAYVEEFPMGSNAGNETTNDYEETLVNYVNSLGYTTQRNWTGRGSETLSQLIRRYDYSGAKARLIPSTPGYHRVHDNTQPARLVGHLALRDAVRRFAPTPDAIHPAVCQVSSIGSLSKKYLLEFQTSIESGLTRKYPKAGDVASDQSLRFKLVFPTMKEIFGAMGGIMQGGCVCGSKRNVSADVLRPLWHKWAANSASGPLEKPKNVPHIKSFFQTNREQDGFDWMVIGSHNLSTAAWGSVKKNDAKHGGGHSIYVKSWELAVFLSPQTLGVDKLLLWGNDNGGSGRTATVPLPYKINPDPYDSNDEPWTAENIMQGMQ